LQGQTDWFREIRKQPILLHHPFESFSPVVEFLRQAAEDPDVLAIKQTLYRTGPKSPIVDALVSASRAGKEVTVVIELRARFDEKDNISLATRLQEAAVHVVYGVVGYKTHAKMMLVLRREGRKLRSYVHLGSGNYHPSTARLYTDYGLLTSDSDLVEDVQRVFVQLTSLGKLSKLKKLLQSPFTLHEALLDKIEREIDNKTNGKPARIIFKLNSLVEPQAMEALFRASIAGVEIKLIVRGICCLRPGIERISENIEVRSIIGRFLEHTRVYYFENGGEPEIFVSSADLMNRNMFHRVEVAFPIEFKRHRDRVIRDLEFYLADNCQAWIMRPDGTYRMLNPGDDPPFEVQTALLAVE
jgi:polyphosphate kinase